MQEPGCWSCSSLLVVAALLVVTTLLVPRRAVGVEHEVGGAQALDTLSPYQGRQLNEIAFPLGGIGAGSISLGGRGDLRNWAIFNRPNIGSRLPYSWFLVWVQEEGRDPVAKVLESPPGPPYVDDGHGRGLYEIGAGLPHVASSTFSGEYPFAQVEFQDTTLPVKMSVEAYNPFIPLNDDDSSIPVAILAYRVENTCANPVEATIAMNIFNPIGYAGNGGFFGPHLGKNVNEFVKRGPLKGLYLTSEKHPAEDPRFGQIAVTTPWPEVTCRTHWLRAGWFDSFQDFWEDFSADGIFTERSYGPSEEGQSDTGSVGARIKLLPGESVTIPFYISWYFPTFVKYWVGSEPPTWKNYYASKFSDALDVAEYVHENIERLYSETRLFHDTLFESTLPEYVLDAASSQMSTLKTTTCLRLEDGRFYAFEGSSNKGGCCEGSCTHVWNYAQALPFLFPALERSMRTTDYEFNLQEDGKMCFRLQLPLGSAPWEFHGAADGQMGGIIKLYRDWKISGDDDWLAQLWPLAQRALEYAWKEWDKDRDGVMEGIQHNTYDIEFSGPNTMMGSLYLGALRAAEEICRYRGDDGKADEYRAVFEKGRERMDEELFNGEYYIHKFPLDDPPPHQYGEGCLSDQLIGQWMAHMNGLGYLFDPEHVRSSMQAIFKHNWHQNLEDHANCQRVYALNDEPGLILCSWPRGNKLVDRFVYSDEVWCGIEYQVASHLIYEGMIDEALQIVKGVRARHDGERRNPWDEFECGHHYARSMASWALLIALSGYSFDMPTHTLGFRPRINQEGFKVFWSTDSGWGIYSQRKAGSGGTATFDVRYGSVRLKRLYLGSFDGVRKVKTRLGAVQIRAELLSPDTGVVVEFVDDITIDAEDEPLVIELK